jgi:hypothetical protein
MIIERDMLRTELRRRFVDFVEIGEIDGAAQRPARPPRGHGSP